MSRAAIDYSVQRTFTGKVVGAVDVTEPVAGFYKLKLGRDTAVRAVRIWFGPPHDPVTGEELDRSWRWQARLDTGDAVEFDVAWPKCAKDMITEDEWRRCCARTEWARKHAPESAYAERGRRHDPLSSNSPLPF